VTIGEVGILDDDVFGRTVDAQAVGVFTGLDRNAIVVHVDVHIVDAYMLRRIDIDAV
jgi:hypothetical protein